VVTSTGELEGEVQLVRGPLPVGGGPPCGPDGVVLQGLRRRQPAAPRDHGRRASSYAQKATRAAIVAQTIGARADIRHAH
jgi:hypothetical protein